MRASRRRRRIDRLAGGHRAIWSPGEGARIAGADPAIPADRVAGGDVFRAGGGRHRGPHSDVGIRLLSSTRRRRRSADRA